MGSCAYYLKAMFRTEDEATEIQPRLERLFLQLIESRKDNSFRPRHKAASENYPLAMEFIKTLPTWKDKTDLRPQTYYVDVGGDETNGVEQYDNVLYWADADVGHMTNWTPLVKFIKSKFNAVRVVWGSEENGVSSMDGLSLYDWEAIVTDLLKQKAMLPLMLGINNELDELISLHLD